LKKLYLLWAEREKKRRVFTKTCNGLG